MAVVLSRLPRLLAARGAGRPQTPLGALLSDPALKEMASDSSALQLYGGDDQARVNSGFGKGWRSMWCSESVRRALQSSTLISVFMPRARATIAGAARGRQTSGTRTGPMGCSCLSTSCPGGHERWHVGTLRSGWSRRVIPRSDACSVPCAKLVYDRLHMCNALV